MTKIHYSASGTPSCAGLLDLRLVVLPAAWGYQAEQGASRLESPELKSPPVGQSESYKHLGLISGLCGAWTKVIKVCWCSWSWKWVFVSRDNGSPGMDGLLQRWTLNTPRLQVGGLIKELQVWQVQEPLQWSGCFVYFTTRKYWQNVSVQSHFQHCVLCARWLMENTLCVPAGPCDD